MSAISNAMASFIGALAMIIIIVTFAAMAIVNAIVELVYAAVSFVIGKDADHA